MPPAEVVLRRAIARLRAGDIGGLEDIVNAYQVQAVRAAYLITHDRAAAEDIVQNVFVRVSERIHQYDPGRPFEPWFFRAVINDAVKVAARRGREVDLEAGDDGPSLLDVLVDPSPAPDEAAERAEIESAVWEALHQLSPKQRAAAVMRYYLAYDEAEIAAALTVPAGTVKWRLHEARRNLRGLLTPLWRSLNGDADESESAPEARTRTGKGG
ncbi:MAG: sigma-70 family RNA polymerase sigma factor [Chloroflexi bacterium]|nr:sigma-70 family RNA polymerase sigma factor [Chloroflexota bacterium]